AVKSPRTGWLVPVDDDAALWLAMRAVIDDPMGAIARGMAGRSLMEREFSVKSMVEGNIAVYDWVLKTKA
ncbi:MAG: glycosyltransferase family 1 protein, partial [Armatimonadetes bacterium]|nr:glycosyltransferase family 1 protein [Armatimonadota bacterium]